MERTRLLLTAFMRFHERRGEELDLRKLLEGECSKGLRSILVKFIVVRCFALCFSLFTKAVAFQVLLGYVSDATKQGSWGIVFVGVFFVSALCEVAIQNFSQNIASSYEATAGSEILLQVSRKILRSSCDFGSIKQASVSAISRPQRILSSCVVIPILALVIAVQIYLFSKIGWCAWVSLAFFGLSAFLNSAKSRKTKSFRKSFIRANTERVSLTNSLMNSIFSVKALSAEEFWTETICDRNKITQSYRRKSQILGWGATELLRSATELSIFLFFYGISLSSGGILTQDVFAGIIPLVRLMAGKINELNRIKTAFDKGVVEDEFFEDFLLRSEFDVAPEVFGTSESAFVALNMACFMAGEFRLRDVSLEVFPGDWLSISGPQGSGKSTLLRGVLEEVPLVAGLRCIEGSRAAALHDPVLFGTTIRSNILFGLPFHEERYRMAVSATALETDFECFAEGDQAAIVGASSGLSGGQRHRIDLARCLYSSSQIVLLDDPVSDLDAKVERFVLSQLRECLKCRCVFFSTNQAGKHAIETDSVITLDNGCVRNYSAKHNGTTHPMDSAGARECRSEPFLTFAVETFLVGSNVKGPSLEKLIIEIVGVRFLGVVLLVCLSTGLELYSFFWVSSWILNQPVSFDLFLGIYGSILVLSLSIMFAATIFFESASSKFFRTLFRKVLVATVHADFCFFVRSPPSLVLSPFSTGMWALFNGVDQLQQASLAFVALLSIVASSAVVYPLSISAIPVFLVNLFLIGKIFVPVLSTCKRLRSARLDALQGAWLEMMSGARVFRRYFVENTVLKTTKDLISRLSAQQLIGALFNHFLTSILLSLNVVFVAAAALYAVFVKQHSSPLFLSILEQTGSVLLSLFFHLLNYDMQLSMIVSLLRRMEMPPEQWPGSTLPPQGWPRSGKVEFVSVWFSYESNLAPVLKNISFVVHAKESFGIVGRTGAGKSTVFSLIFGFALFDGAIFIDGVDSKSVRLPALRSALSYVTQSAMFSPGSLRSNLDMYGVYTDSEISGCLKEVGLKNRSLEDGIDVKSLSQGEKQLLNLARALLSSSRILCVDEGSANLDEAAAEIVESKILSSVDVTRLIIAHRLNFVLKCNFVAVLDKGRMVETGNPTALLKRNGGLSSLVASWGEGGEFSQNDATKRRDVCVVCCDPFSPFKKELTCKLCRERLCTLCEQDSCCLNCKNGVIERKGVRLPLFDLSVFPCELCLTQAGPSRKCCLCEKNACNACLVYFRQIWNFAHPWVCSSCWPSAKSRILLSGNDSNEAKFECFQGDNFVWMWGSPVTGTCTCCRKKQILLPCGHCKSFVCLSCSAFWCCPDLSIRSLTLLCHVCAKSASTNLIFEFLGSPPGFFCLTDAQERSIKAGELCVNCGRKFDFFLLPYACEHCNKLRCSDCCFEPVCNGCASSHVENELLCDGCKSPCQVSELVFVNEKRFHQSCVSKYKDAARICAECGGAAIGKSNVLLNGTVLHAECLVSYRRKRILNE